MTNPHIADAVERRIARNLQQRAANVGDSLIRNPERMQARTDAATRLQELWASLIPEGTPDLTTFYDWFDRFGSTVERGIRRTSDKAKTKRRTPGGHPFTAEGAARYASATIRGMAEGDRAV